ncbi:MAG: hypothetical protein H6959_04975 [Chromatiaceae bacterium]|nr:hypothetical protein [Gammaproteobacteria bacterium]MCP5300176.1 hypothetical protein [Chromatiaceae bacterium]MCP5422248.1 hypothetical protein [Chromatiaceae bacterium]
MRFHQLPIGARFEWRGARYRKVSPLMASGEADATQKLVARSAEVTPLGDAAQRPTAPSGLPSTLSGPAVAEAAQDFFAHCRAALQAVDPALTAAQRAALLDAIETAAREMLTGLATPPATDC